MIRISFNAHFPVIGITFGWKHGSRLLLVGRWHQKQSYYPGWYVEQHSCRPKLRYSGVELWQDMLLTHFTVSSVNREAAGFLLPAEL